MAARVRWVKEWVPQSLIASGGRCLVLKWVREDALRTLKEEIVVPEQEKEPEPTTETLFLCSYEGCGKTFFDVPSLKKHSHQVHHERQYVCHYEGCGKKFVDSSKLKRHYLIHTGVKDYVCPHEGCGKAFSLDFNLRAHMKTHSLENYHICPHVDCGKRFTHDYKLQAHIKAHHEKNATSNTTTKRTSPTEKLHSAVNPPAIVEVFPSADRPYACPFEGCNKAYIHEYKLNLHLKREHPHHNADGNGGGEYDGKKSYVCPYEGCSKSYLYEYKLNLHLKREHPQGLIPEGPATYTPAVDDNTHEAGRRDTYYPKAHACPYEGCRKSYIHEYKLNLHLRKEHPGHSVRNNKHSRAEDHEDDEGEYEYAGNSAATRTPKRFRPDLMTEAQSPDVTHRATSSEAMKKQWSANQMRQEDSEDDSEKTDEEDRDNDRENGWESDEEENDDDEETEDDED